MRIADIDQHAKDVKYFPDAEFLPLAGARHVPMMCSVRKTKLPFTRAAASAACTFQQRMHCRQAWQQNDAFWQQFQDQFTQVFQSFKHDAPPDHSLIDDLHKTLVPTSHQFFTSKNSSTISPASPDPQSQLIRNKWFHKKTTADLSEYGHSNTVSCMVSLQQVYSRCCVPIKAITCSTRDSASMICCTKLPKLPIVMTASQCIKLFRNMHPNNPRKESGCV